MTDEEIIRAFPLQHRQSVPGYIVDYLGTKTRVSYFSHLSHYDGLVEDYPLQGDFHATSVEWAGVLRAALDAKEEVVGVELGAGWAPWLVSLARACQMKGISTIHLVGVEASKGHYEFMHSHFLDNGLDPRQHTLLHGVIGPSDGSAEFPILPDPRADWGAAAVFANGSNGNGSLGWRHWRPVRPMLRLLRRPHTPKGRPTERVPCFSLPTLFRPYAHVDLVHVDIQGDEFRVLHSARQVLKEKVKRLVVATHTRSIEQQLLQDMPSHAWVLEADEACKYRQDGQGVVQCMDGCQVWRNSTFDSPATVPQ
jgi:FkbM family methyltransferase